MGERRGQGLRSQEGLAGHNSRTQESDLIYQGERVLCIPLN